MAEQVGGGMRLRLADLVERDVDPALGEVPGVPIGFPVPEEPERPARQGQAASPSFCSMRWTAGRASMRSKWAATFGGNCNPWRLAPQYST